MSGLSGPGFPDRLARLAQRIADPRCAALAGRLQRPVTVAVRGRAGVGVRTVTRALAAAGVAVRAAGDVNIRVIAEVTKPEDLAARPELLVLNKADLAGFGDRGPLAVSRARAAELTRHTGVPTEPLVALLAVAALEPGVLDDDVLRAVRVLAGTPADMSSPDAFVAGEHRLPRADRQRLVERLDLFGIAHAVLARDDPEGVPAVLRRVSRIDEVCARVDAAAAEVRYRRLLAVVAELEAISVRNPEVARFLAADDTVTARMAAAAEVIAAAGLPVATDDGRLRTAVRWRRYGAGPVDPLHRACAADLTRGALRAGAA